jgi:hypothetical protein
MKKEKEMLVMEEKVEKSTRSFMNKEKFAAELHNLTETHKINYFDAVLMYCEDHDLEVEDIVKFIDQNLKERIEQGAIENSLVAERPTLFD